MPYEGNSQRHTAVATKAVNHGNPTIEDGFPGIAFKTTQLNAYVAPNATAATQIAIGESFVIQFRGMHEAAAARFTGGTLPALGDPIYIIAATNVLTTTASGNVKFGRVDRIDAARGVAYINGDARDTF